MSGGSERHERPGLAFAGIFLVTFLGLLAVGAVLPVLPRYVHGPLDAGNVAVGVVIGSYAITGLLLRPVAGRFADHRGRKPVVVAGCSLAALSGFLYLLPLGVPGLIGARLVLGAGEGAVFTAGSAWIVDLAPLGRRGRVIGLYGLAVWSGLSVGPLLGELLQRAGGYTEVWLLAGALPLLGAAIASQVPDPFRPAPLLEQEHHPLIAKEAVRPGTALALGSIGYGTIAAFVVLLLEARGVGHGAGVFGAFATMVVLTRLAGGDLPDRIGPARVAVAAACVEAAGLATIAVAHSLPVALAGALAMGAAFSLLYPSLSLIVVNGVSDRRRGAALGTFTAFFDAGVGLGAPLAGLAAALTSYEGAFFLAATIALVSATVIALTISPRAPELHQLVHPADGQVDAVRRSALFDQQRLGGAADPAALVEEDRLCCADAARLGAGDGVDADPLALGQALEVDGEVDVDEDEVAVVEHGADPVADVGGDQRPLQRRRLLALHERPTHAQPEGRRARLDEGARHRPELHRRVVAVVLPGGEELGDRPFLRSPRRRVPSHRLRRNPQLRRPQLPGRSPHHLRLVDEKRGLDHPHFPPRPHHPCLDPNRPDRHRPENLEHHPPHLKRLRAFESLNLASQECRRRPRMLRPGVPRPPRKLSGDVLTLATPPVESVHRRGSYGR